MKLKSIIKSCCIVAIAATSMNFNANALNPQIEKRIDKIISQMTLEQKIDMLGVIENYNIRGVADSIPKMLTSDGPLGVRNYGRSTQYPCGPIAAATWNKSLVYKEGTSFARDAHARGVHIVLAPGVDIMRSTLCGRNFEYYSEDPYLAGTMAVNFIKGLQDHGVAACIKHFALNDMEWGRSTISSNCDLRTMHEIYLPAFRMAVEQAKVASIMDGYNLVNGTYMTANDYLNNKVLRGMWGFEGVVMSDWGACHDAVADANGGCDLDMTIGDPQWYNREKLLPAVKEGKVSQATIDGMVRNVLRLCLTFGFENHPQKDSSIALDNAESDAVALQIAQEGIVLLKNAGILPLKKGIKNIAVIGPRSDEDVIAGGSSTTIPFHSVSAYQGIKELLPNASITCLSDNGNFKFNGFYTTQDCKKEGINAEFFNNIEVKGEPEYKAVLKQVKFNLGSGSPALGVINEDGFSGRFTGYLNINNSDSYTFSVTGDDGYRLWVDGNLAIDDWVDQAPTTKTADVTLTKGVHKIRLEYFDEAAGTELSLSYRPQQRFANAVAMAKAADVAIVCVGYGTIYESEGTDRVFDMPDNQNGLVNAVADANPNTIVVYYAGGNTNMPWLNKVKGVIYAGYPGQEGGKAVAQILTGKVNPSGKLTATFEKQWTDDPSHDNFFEKNKGDGFITYAEKLLVGYRYYDRKNVSVNFPFGFGLSYTKFAYSNLKIKRNDNTDYTVTVDIKNIGKVAGAESAQLYVEPQNATAEEPIRTLKDFGKVYLQPGEKKTVTMKIDKYAFSSFNVEASKWLVNAGQYTIQVGASSRDLRLKNIINVK
jgi:beta-glucosidase